MTYSRAVAILCFTVVMLITALTPLGLTRPPSVDAPATMTLPHRISPTSMTIRSPAGGSFGT